MNNALIKKILSSCLFVLLALAIECYTFASLGWGLFPKYAFFDIGLILFFAFLIFAIPNTKLSNTLFCIVIGFQILVSYINIIMKNMLNTVFTIKMMALVGETAEVLTPDMFPWSPIIFYGILIAVLVGSLIFISKIPVDKKKESFAQKYILRFAVAVGLACSFLVYTVQGLFIEKSYLMGDNYLYNTFSDGQQSLKKFGSYGFYFEDLFRIVDKPDNLLSITKEDVEKYLSTETYNPKDSSLWNIANGEQNVFVIMAESFEWYAINKEMTPVLYALANGYDFGSNAARLYDIYDFDNECEDGTLMRKDYLYDENGLCIGKNGNISYNDDYNNTYGLTLINYYSKAKTDYSEDSEILGSYPFNKSYVERLGFTSTGLYTNVKYNFTLPNVLKDSGYLAEGEAWYFHTYKSTFYARQSLIPMFGFDHKMFFEDFVKNENVEHNDKLSHAIRDSEVMRYYSDDYIHIKNGETTSKPWLSFFTTVTTHGEYSTYNPRIYKNYVFLDNVNYAGKPTTSLKTMADKFVSGTSSEKKNADKFWGGVDGAVATYLAGCLDTEYMVARLIDALVKSNQFEKTTIVFYADHNGYYNQLDLLYKPYYYNDQYTDFEQFRIDYVKGKVDLGAYDVYSSERYSVPAFIYSTALDETATGVAYDSENNPYKVQYIEKFTCAFDLLPTIFTICGVEYNPHYYLGYPVICPATVDGEQVELGTKVIISHTGGYFNNLVFSEDGSHANYMVGNVNMKEFYNDCVNHLEKWYYITALYDYNMFDKVEKTK